jgi:hypothetical protein
MNTVQTNQEKRTIKVKDFLNDFYSGMADGELLKRYHLTPAGLEKFYSMLLDRGILASQELQDHRRQENLRRTADREDQQEKAGYICPACLVAQDTMFDICPECGVSFHELMSRERRLDNTVPEDQQAHSPVREKSRPLGEKLLGAFGGVRKANFFRAGEARHEEKLAEPPAQEEDESYFAVADKSMGDHVGFDDPMDEIVHGSPLEDANDDTDPYPPTVEALCDSCQERMQSGLRDIYDRGRSHLAMKMAATFLIVGILGCLMVSFFDGYSLLRLAVVCATGISFLAGTALLTVASFMFLAREKVYYCPLCKRVYPRG